MQRSLYGVLVTTFGLTALACAGTSGGAVEPSEDHASEDHAAGHPGAHRSGADEGHGHGGHHPGHAHDFSDVERFARVFDDPARDAWQRPDEVTRLLALEPGMTVADLGAGTGYFLPHLSPAVGDAGRVLALDVEENMVAHMDARVREAGLENVSARLVATDDPGLEPASVDRVLVVDTWHHIADRVPYAERLRAALRPDGFVLVVDFTEDSPHGPPPAMRLDERAVVSDLEGAGFTVDVLEETLPYQYAVRGRR